MGEELGWGLGFEDHVSHTYLDHAWLGLHEVHPLYTQDHHFISWGLLEDIGMGWDGTMSDGQ